MLVNMARFQKCDPWTSPGFNWNSDTIKTLGYIQYQQKTEQNWEKIRKKSKRV